MKSSKSFCSSADSTSLEGADNNRKRSRPCSESSLISLNIVSDPKSKAKGSKKFQKVKYEIDRQRFAIAKLNREIEMKSQRGFPSPCLHKLRVQVCIENKKLNEMIKRAIEIQARDGKDKWGPIQTSSETPCDKSLEPPMTPSNLTGVSAFTDLNLAESFLNENDFLENDRCKLQEQLLNKDCELEHLERKIENLQCQLMKNFTVNKIMANDLARSLSHTSVSKCDSNLKLRTKAVVSQADKLTSDITLVESSLCQLRNELKQVHKERKIAFDLNTNVSKSASSADVKSSDDCSTSRPKTCPCNVGERQSSSELKNLQSQYTNLQIEFCRKEKQCKDMAERMKKCMDDGNGDNERTVNEALNKRADALVGEIGDYKVFIKELQEQVDLYRNKFMTAQEKVEHQRYLLESLEMSNKSIEQQINDEITKIKEKFQAKLSELCPFPKMYEESELELIKSKEKIKTLETDLKGTVAALCKAKCELKKLKEQPDESIEKEHKKLQCEIEMLKKKSCAMKATKECLEAKLISLRSELENLRRDSSKIISTTKCCAEKNQQVLNQHINGLEIELAQCRAHCAISLTEKEEVVKKMKNELAILCCHFNDCQGQIKQLKNQVACLTNQHHNIRPEDLDENDCCSNLIKQL